MPRALRPTLFALVFASSCDAPKHQAPHAYPPIVAPAVAGPPPATPSASAPSLVASTPEPAPPSPPRPAEVERLDLPGLPPVSLVRSSDGGPPRIVFFPGICSNAYAYLLGFPEAARSHGGAIALEGDRPCGAASGFRSITSDPAHEEPRIDAALRAAGVVSPETADLVYVGYSLGATLVENLVRKSPERYRRVVLIASPRDPRLDRLKGAQAVATLSCSLDVPGRMKGAVRMLKNAGIASKYFEMPGCTHGNLADGERVLDEVFGWIEASVRLLLPPARAPLVGDRLIGHPPCSTGHTDRPSGWQNTEVSRVACPVLLNRAASTTGHGDLPMLPAPAPALVSERPQGVAWSAMPAWFHAATFVYFATNVFNGWVTLKLGAPAPASALLIFGLLGGFIEHISPYYPKVFIPAFWEKLLFRVPTIVGYMWLALWMNMAWYVIAAFTLHAIVFLRQSALTSMELRYHVEHVLGTHVSGAAGMTILLLLKSGHLPALRAILMP